MSQFLSGFCLSIVFSFADRSGSSEVHNLSGFLCLSHLKPVTQRCHPERDAKGKWPQCDYGHLVALRRVTEC